MSESRNRYTTFSTNTFPKVSVIIPVYKAEQFISKCAQTLFAQTLDDIEFIFVDDCSPDKSIDIMLNVLDDFPNRKHQVKIIRHNKNMGVSNSRQDGLNVAKGEYIIQCDPDDWVDHNMYSILYENAQKTNSDLVICDFSRINNSEIKYIKQDPNYLTATSLLQSISGLSSHYIHGSTCNKLIKSELCRSAYFPSDISYAEDVYLMFQILSKDIKITYVDKSLYFYRYNPDSLVNNYSIKSLTRDFNLIKHFENLKSKSIDKTYVDCCNSFIISVIYFRFFRMSNISNATFKQNFYQYTKYIKLNKNIKFPFNLLLKISGLGYFRQVLFLLKIYKVIKRRYI